MANSALQPISVTDVRTAQDASQFRLKPPPDPACAPPSTMLPPWPSLVTWPSYSSAVRVGAEHEPVLLIVERVEDHAEAVAVVQRRVAPRLRRDDRRRRPVVADHADVQRVLGEPDAHLGALGRRLALVRGGLPEVAAGGHPCPRVVADHVAVDVGAAASGEATICRAWGAAGWASAGAEMPATSRTRTRRATAIGSGDSISSVQTHRSTSCPKGSRRISCVAES